MQAEIGIVYNPITDELFTALAGKGAFCNGTKLQVTNLEGTLSLNIIQNLTKCCFSYCRRVRGGLQ